MRADDDIDRPVIDPLHGTLDFLRCCEPGEHRDADRIASQALLQVVVMLLDKDGGRRKKHRLFSVHDALKYRAKSNLRFSESDIAAQESVHGLFRLHVSLDVLDRIQLIFRLLIGEIVFKLRLPYCVRGKSISIDGLSFRIELDEVKSELLDGVFRAAYGLAPLGGSEAGKLRCPSVGSDIFLDMVEAVHRDIKMVVVRIGDLQVVSLRTLDFEVYETVISADAVFIIDDQFTRNKIREQVDRHAAFFLLFDTAVHTENILCSDEDHVDRRIDKSTRQRLRQQHRHAVFLEEERPEFIGTASRTAHDIRRLSFFISSGDQLGKSIFVASVAVAGRALDLDMDTSGKTVITARQDRHRDDLFLVEFAENIRDLHQRSRALRRDESFFKGIPETRFKVCSDAVHSGSDLRDLIDIDRVAHAPYKGEDRLGVFFEDGRPLFPSGKRTSGPERFTFFSDHAQKRIDIISIRADRRRFSCCLITDRDHLVREALPVFRRKQELGGRKDRIFFQLLFGSLGIEIKELDLIDFVIEERQSHTHIRSAREEIEDISALGKFTDTLNFAGTHISHRNQGLCEVFRG